MSDERTTDIPDPEKDASWLDKVPSWALNVLSASVELLLWVVIV